MAAEKKLRKLTPTGEAKWAHVQTPKKPFDDKGEPKYMIDVVFDPKDPAWASWARDVQETIKGLPEQTDKKTGEVCRKQSPIKRDLDEMDQPTGKFVASFKTSAKFKPSVFNKHGKALAPDVMIGNGSKVRINYCENVYEGFGGGMNLYLNAVQVVDLVEYGTRSADSYGFEVQPETDSDELPPF